MSMRTYPAIVSQDESAGADAGYGVVFPDFPGCVTGGRTQREAAEMAAKALAFHVEGMIETGLDLPEPSVDGRLPAWWPDDGGPSAVTIHVPIDMGLVLAEADSAAFADALLHPKPVNDRVRDTVRRYRERTGG